MTVTLKVAVILFKQNQIPLGAKWELHPENTLNKKIDITSIPITIAINILTGEFIF